jgi:hypothetical protein
LRLAIEAGRGYAIISNHQSIYDIPVILRVAALPAADHREGVARALSGARLAPQAGRAPVRRPTASRSDGNLEALARLISDGLSLIIFGGMTLKEGRQKDYFDNALKEQYPQLVTNYANIYKGDAWGHATWEYYRSINSVFNQTAKSTRYIGAFRQRL